MAFAQPACRKSLRDYARAAIIKKRFHLHDSLHRMLIILSVTVIEKISLAQTLASQESDDEQHTIDNQLNLFIS